MAPSRVYAARGATLAIVAPVRRGDADEEAATNAKRLAHLAAAILMGGTLWTAILGATPAAAAEFWGSPRALTTLIAVEEAQLIAIDGATADYFSSAVAIDGDTALIGAPGSDVDGKENQRLAYVFVRSSSGWTLQ